MLFKITTENFDGPIDLLLGFIEKRKIPINDISLAEITDDYIQFIQKMEEYPLAEISHFIFVASILALIKSKSLLPSISLTEEEEGDIDELKKRIRIFKIYQEASLSLKKSFHRKKIFYEAKTRKREISFQAHESLQKETLKNALRDIFSEIPQKESKKKEASIKINLHIEEIMNSLEKRIREVHSFVFRDFIKKETKGKENKKTIKAYNVVGFLAVLEMVKNGIFHVIQKHTFEDIILEQEKEDKIIMDIR